MIRYPNPLQKDSPEVGSRRGADPLVREGAQRRTHQKHKSPRRDRSLAEATTATLLTITKFSSLPGHHINQNLPPMSHQVPISGSLWVAQQFIAAIKRLSFVILRPAFCAGRRTYATADCAYAAGP